VPGFVPPAYASPPRTGSRNVAKGAAVDGALRAFQPIASVSSATQPSWQPLIVGIGGSTRAGSSSERLLRTCLAAAERHGARTVSVTGPALRLPIYEADSAERTDAARELVEAIRAADGLVIASPGYHGGISGLVKNALDYVEDLRSDARPYLDGRAVGCISAAAGWQAAGSTLQALRAVVHALRGWPTPLGVAVNSELPVWDGAGAVGDRALVGQLEILTGQVVDFARRWDASRSGGQTATTSP
jgi:FMN reductase